MTNALQDIVKAYDVRGLVATQLTPQVAYALGVAVVEELGLVGKPFVVGHDMRPSSPELARALESGAAEAGAHPMPIGLCSTDMVYFASGHFDAAAAMITASHNPAEYNGIKFAKAGAKGVSLNTGLAGIRDRAIAYLEANPEPTFSLDEPHTTDVLGDYVSYLRSLVALENIRPLKVVVDAANGMGGFTVPAVLGEGAGFAALPLEVTDMYFELDGTFPNHEANPLEPKNIVDLQKAVVEHSADIGIAFDGDADRCFVVDEKGDPVSPSVIGALVAKREITRVREQLGEDSTTVLHNLICSNVVKETIEAEGATAVRTPVGHSLIKDEMARTNAVFGAEHSAHYYFRDFYGADSGMLAAMHVLAELGNQDGPLSVIGAEYSPYVQSGEINTRVSDTQATVQAVADAFAGKGEVDRLDGLSVVGRGTGADMWWFNVRASNTEPLLRLNIEAATKERLDALTAEVLAIISAG